MKVNKVILVLLGLVSIAVIALMSCFRKKGEPKNLGDWLEKNMPGQLQVLDSNLKMLDVMAQFKGEKQALVADRNNEEIQFLLDWSKDSVNLGLNPQNIQDQLAYARERYQRAVDLYQKFVAEGFDKVAVGVNHPNIFIQYYAEPTPGEREKFKQTVLKVMTEWIKTDGFTLYLQIMEPASYQAKMKNIIPYGHFITENGWQQDQEILSLSTVWKDIKSEPWQWDINVVSVRAQAFTDLAFEKAQAWAQKHLPKGATLEEGKLIGFDIVKHAEHARQKGDPHSPSIRISFPYTDGTKGENDEPAGYVTCVYDFDSQLISQFMMEKEGY